jgi:cytochrome c5
MSAERKSTLVRDTSMVLMFIVGSGVVAFIVAKIIFSTSADIDDSDVAVAERLAPIGSVNIGEPFVLDNAAKVPVGAAPAAHEPETTVAVVTTEAAPAALAPGQEAYGKICFACHDAGIGGAPKTGDVDEWNSRSEKGTEMLVINAINGLAGDTGIMPPKGGMASLSDDDVRAAVMYMLPAGEDTSAPAEAPAVETPMAEPDAEVATATAMSDGRGKEVYDSACFICHATGVAGAPKTGDVADWAPRINQGTDMLYTHAVKGFMGEAGLMPPKGGRMDFSDADVNAAVDYMVNESQ